jgi:hypothetical protein
MKKKSLPTLKNELILDAIYRLMRDLVELGK